MGVAVEGSEQVWPSRGDERLVLPALDIFERQPRFIEIFNRGQQAFDYTIAAEPWVVLDKPAGQVRTQQRVFVDVRWDQVPAGVDHATLTVSGPDHARTHVRVPLRRAQVDADFKGFVETGGVVSMEAEHFTRAVAASARQWLQIPGHGRTLSGMTALPVDAPAAPQPEMRLEYELQLFSAGEVRVQATLAPTQKFQPGPGLRYAISFDDEAPQTVNIHQDASLQAWERSVSDGATVLTTHHRIAQPGQHTLKFWVVDSGLVLQKLVVDAGGQKPSYLGPPESPRR
jgi:hypothetical protein